MDVEELLGDWNPEPFNRYSSLEHDAILIVEFCESVGPRPALLIPTSPGPHLEADDLALWLMTADYHLSNSSTSFAVASDDVALMLHNEEQGIHAYVHHLLLYDLAARGFHRPFAVAYLTREANLLPALLPRLRPALLSILNALQSCNRRAFLRQVAAAMDTLHSVNSQAVAAYYELYYEAQSLPQTPAQRLHLKARKLHADLEAAHAALTAALANAKQEPNFPECSLHEVPIDAWMSKVMERKESEETSQQRLRPLAELAPCVYAQVELHLRQLWSRFSRETLADSLFRPLFTEAGPSVLLDHEAILKLPPSLARAGKRSEEEEEEWERREPREEKRKGSEERELLGMLDALPSLMAALWSGQFLLIAGSELRRWTVQSVVGKLRRAVPSGADGVVRFRRWHRGRVPPTAFMDFRLFGLSLPANAPLSAAVASNVLPFLHVLHLNEESLTTSRCKSGRLNRALTNKSPQLFPSDRHLLAYLACVGAEYGALAFLLYALVFKDAALYRRRAKHLDSLATRLRLAPYELRILRHLVDLLKAQEDDATTFQGDFDSLFLDSQPLAPIKLS